MQKLVASSLASVLIAGQMITPVVAHAASSDFPTVTPIKHVVVIFDENISFDHYFGTYPNGALNLPGEPVFTPQPHSPNVNGLTQFLQANNPNLNKANGTGSTNPFRLSRAQAATADMDHDYTPEQQAFDSGLMDLFPLFTGAPNSSNTPVAPSAPPPIVSTNGLVMGYYDGNTVTALWNYAQRYAMSDNSYGTNFGPSTDGAINLISGQTNGVQTINGAESSVINDGNGGMTLVSDADPTGDVCSSSTNLGNFAGKNIGDLLNDKGVSWGFFEGGFDLTITNSNGTTNCKRSTLSTITKTVKADYIPHHQPFQYYASTANPSHKRPTSVSTIGQPGDAANHQYDTHDFFDAVSAGNFPAVSFLKAPGFQDGHAGYSDPLDEQTWIVNTINFLQAQPDWASTAVVIAYDDSDGWYDHQLGQIVNGSATSVDALTGPGLCGTGANALPGVNPSTLHAQGRCGFGPRLPMLVISPWAQQNYVDHSLLDQTSIIKFVEDNWLGSERIGAGSYDTFSTSIVRMMNINSTPQTTPPNIAPLILDPTTGTVVK
jgi:phospholipase C